MRRTVFCTTLYLLAATLFFLVTNKQVTANWLDRLSGLLELESFEGETFPPEGWNKITRFEGSGWSQGRANEPVLGMEFFGAVDTPPGGGDFLAYASWATGDLDTNFTTSDSTDQWLITPQITSIENGDSLKFWLRTFGEFDDQLDILISTTGDSMPSFDTTVATFNFNKNSDPAWQPKGVDLSFFQGQDIYIAFREHVGGTLLRGDAILLDLVEVSSLVTSVRTKSQGPTQFSLSQNYPNPFNPQTEIRFSLEKPANVKMTVYNLSGQQIAVLTHDQRYSAGMHRVQFNGANLPNGVYYYKLESNGFLKVKKMTLLK